MNLLALKDHMWVVYRQEDVLAFEVIDWNKKPEGYFHKSSGVVSPLLQWTTEFIGNVPE